MCAMSPKEHTIRGKFQIVKQKVFQLKSFYSGSCQGQVFNKTTEKRTDTVPVIYQRTVEKFILFGCFHYPLVILGI